MTADAQEIFSAKRLVVFGAGYVGSAVVRQAIARGLWVTALTRNAAKAAALQELGATTVVADLADDGWHRKISGGAEWVLNCVSSGGGGLGGYARSYLGGMKSILRWSAAQGAPGTILYTSSTSVYPQCGGARIDETAPTLGSAERAQVLVAAENALREVEQMGARWFILRLAGIYGPGRHHLLEQVRSGEVAGYGDHHLNVTHLEDICAAIWAAFDAPARMRNEVFNVADDGATKKAEIVAWIAGELGISAPRFSGEPAEGRRAVTPDRIIDNTKLKAMLGWKPRYPTFREGYRALLRA